MRASWSDWWASRTIRFNAFLGAIWAALLPVIVMWDEADWAKIGMDEKWAMIAVLVVQVVSNAANVALRVDTKTPIEGRAMK